MNWNTCISSKRYGQTSETSSRTQYQRDFDRIIFSSAFRRLQNKTQVFPLPGNTFVHNRLTHSLEVSSVGRSLGAVVGMDLINTVSGLTNEAIEFYKTDLSSVIAAGCLAHDLGNPPFGHSGEDAISNYFSQNKNLLIEGEHLSNLCSSHEWEDLIRFEGNANAFHILTNPYSGKFEGGMSLTYSTLASILKYPCTSIDSNKSFTHRKKYGYFKYNLSAFKDVCESTNMTKDENTSLISYKRHPFVYLVEAADDICYRIIDLEDAQRINILSYNFVKDMFLSIIKDLDSNQYEQTTNRLLVLTDHNEAISYLRAKVINILVSSCAEEFNKHKDLIIEGKFNTALFDIIESKCISLQEAKNVSIEKIYNHPSVVQLEITGYKIIYELLDTFVPLSLKSKLTGMERKIKSLIPKQYYLDEDSSAYSKMLMIADYISGMTDGYATELYRKCNGIIIDKHK